MAVVTSSVPVNPLTSYYAPVRAEIVRLAASSWPELSDEILRHLTRCRLPTSVALPLGACAAAGGDPQRAVSTAAGFGLLHLAVRWFDDLQDKDRDDGLWRRVGFDRTVNFAAAVMALAWQALAEDPALPRSVLAELARACVATARGQDIDLCSGEMTLARYWALIDGKTGAGLAFAARAGCLIAGGDELRLAALDQFGVHAGRLVQMLDDLEGVFVPDGVSDLAAGKITLPVLYGLSHPEIADELRALVDAGRLGEEARVRELLDRVDTRAFVLWAALEQRDFALARLAEATDAASPHGEAGRAMLAAQVDLMFCDLGRLLGEVE